MRSSRRRGVHVHQAGARIRIRPPCLCGACHDMTRSLCAVGARRHAGVFGHDVVTEAQAAARSFCSFSCLGTTSS